MEILEIHAKWRFRSDFRRFFYFERVERFLGSPHRPRVFLTEEQCLLKGFNHPKPKKSAGDQKNHPVEDRGGSPRKIKQNRWFWVVLNRFWSFPRKSVGLEKSTKMRKNEELSGIWSIGTLSMIPKNILEPTVWFPHSTDENDNDLKFSTWKFLCISIL